MSNLSQQVQELEKRVESLQYENENLKIMLYRVIASNDAGIEIVPYSDKKADMINQFEFSISQSSNMIISSYKDAYNLTPNNTPDDL